MPLSFESALTVVPNLSAIDDRVSPGLTVYVWPEPPPGEGDGFRVAFGLAVGVGVGAGDGLTDGVNDGLAAGLSKPTDAPSDGLPLA